MKIGQDNIDNQDEYYDDEEYYDEDEYDEDEYDDDEYDDEYDDEDDEDEDDGSPYPKWLIYSGIGLGVVVLLVIVRLVTGGGSVSPKEEFLKRLNDSVKSEYAMKYNLQASDITLPKRMKKVSKKLDDNVSLKGNLNTNGKDTSLTIKSNGLEKLLKDELDAELVVIGDDIYAKGAFGAKEDEYINLSSHQKTKSTAKAKENIDTDKIQKQFQDKFGDFLKNYDEKKFVKDKKGDDISLTLGKSDVKKVVDMSLDTLIKNSKGSTQKDFKSKKKTINKSWDDIESATATITLSKEKHIVITTKVNSDDLAFKIKLTGDISDYKKVKKLKTKDDSKKSDKKTDSKDKSSVDIQSQTSDSSNSSESQSNETQNTDANSDESPAIKDLREYLTNDADGFTEEDAKTVDRQKQVEKEKQAE